MELTTKVTRKVNVKYLKAECGVRYWEDASVNGVEDQNGDLIPLRVGDAWCPTIHLETGKIQDWPQGTEAEIHYKVCDDGRYHLCDEFMNTVASVDGYVPRMMSPKENGYGDYVIMDVGGDGFIKDWSANLGPFEGEE
jgi:hypothetical protein